MVKQTFKSIGMLQSLSLRNSKKNLIMAEAKLLTALSYILGIPGFIYILWLNLGTWKSDILFLAGFFVMVFNVYWKWRRNLRADKKASLENQEKEIELKERELDIIKHIKRHEFTKNG